MTPWAPCDEESAGIPGTPEVHVEGQCFRREAARSSASISNSPEWMQKETANFMVSFGSGDLSTNHTTTGAEGRAGNRKLPSSWR